MIDAKRKQELAEQLGLDKPPVPRMPVPEENKPIPREFRPTFYKALQLVDQIETWAFERFIPDTCAIDQTMDARIHDPQRSACIIVRTDVPPPSNPLIHRATGITPDEASPENFYLWLAIEVRRAYTEWGARRMAPPLIIRTQGKKRRWFSSIVPFIGAITKFDLRISDGSTLDSAAANVGCLVPRGTPIKPGHRAMPLITLDKKSE